MRSRKKWHKTCHLLITDAQTAKKEEKKRKTQTDWKWLDGKEKCNVCVCARGVNRTRNKKNGERKSVKYWEQFGVIDGSKRRRQCNDLSFMGIFSSHLCLMHVILVLNDFGFAHWRLRLTSTIECKTIPYFSESHAETQCDCSTFTMNSHDAKSCQTKRLFCTVPMRHDTSYCMCVSAFVFAIKYANYSIN